MEGNTDRTWLWLDDQLTSKGCAAQNDQLIITTSVILYVNEWKNEWMNFSLRCDSEASSFRYDDDSRDTGFCLARIYSVGDSSPRTSS